MAVHWNRFEIFYEKMKLRQRQRAFEETGASEFFQKEISRRYKLIDDEMNKRAHQAEHRRVTLRTKLNEAILPTGTRLDPVVLQELSQRTLQNERERTLASIQELYNTRDCRFTEKPCTCHIFPCCALQRPYHSIMPERIRQVEQGDRQLAELEREVSIRRSLKRSGTVEKLEYRKQAFIRSVERRIHAQQTLPKKRQRRGAFLPPLLA